MKTSVIEVHDMLSVLSVPEVEKRIGKVLGVESVTVNYSAKTATVRYDETQLQVTEIKAAVRHSEIESEEKAEAKPESKGEPEHKPPIDACPEAKAAPAAPAAASGAPVAKSPPPLADKKATEPEVKTNAQSSPAVDKPTTVNEKERSKPPAGAAKVDEHAGHNKDVSHGK